MGTIRKEAFCRSRVCLAFIVLALSGNTAVIHAQSSTESAPQVKPVDCAHDSEFSKALGMIVGHEVMQEHYKLIDPEVFMNALLSQMYEGAPSAEKRHFELKSSTASTTRYPSIESAIDILKKWPEKASVKKSSSGFIAAYKAFYKSQVFSTTSGLLYRVVSRDNQGTTIGKSNEDGLHEMLMMCRNLQKDTLAVDAEGDSQTICFQRQRIERQTACEIREGQRTHITPDAQALKLDQFPRKYFGLVAHNMIAGWAEALEILNQNWDDAGTTPVLEVIIPSELAYQNDYVADSVRPGEALWFLLTSLETATTN